MSRKTLYTLVITFCILLVVGLVFGYFYINQQKSTPGVSSSEQRGGFFGSLFSIFNRNPGGSNNSSSTIGTSLSATTTVITDTGGIAVIPRLRQISNTPTAGDTFMIQNIASTTIINGKLKNILIPATFIRYMDRATGHIFETKPDDLTTNEISNTTIPKIYESWFTNGGNSVLMRYLSGNENSIETYFATLVIPKAATGTIAAASSSKIYQLSGSFLPENITEIALSPAKDQIFYLKNLAAGSLGIVANTNNSSQRQILNSPLQEWLLSWPTTNTLTLTTKPSGGVSGMSFTLNSSGGTSKRLIDNIAGLTVLSSPDLNNILYAGSTNVNFSLNVYNAKTNGSSALSLKTLPEKCVWSKKTTGVVYCAVPVYIPSGSYPDLWYQGGVSFSDNIWKINVLTGVRSLVARPIDLAKTQMDAVNLALDNNENYLMFINKKDLTLWDLLINPPVTPNFANASSSATSTATSTSH